MDLQSAIEFHCNSIQSDCSFHLCILQPSHMVKVSKSFEPARKPQLVLCVRPTVVEIDGFEPLPVIFSQVCTLTALAAFALSPHSTLLSYTPICLSWTPGGFEPHPPRCQRGVLPGYTTRPIIRQNLARCHQRKFPNRTDYRPSVMFHQCIQY